MEQYAKRKYHGCVRKEWKKKENTEKQARLDFYNNIKSEQPAHFLAANDQQTHDKFSV